MMMYMLPCKVSRGKPKRPCFLWLAYSVPTVKSICYMFQFHKPFALCKVVYFRYGICLLRPQQSHREQQVQEYTRNVESVQFAVRKPFANFAVPQYEQYHSSSDIQWASIIQCYKLFVQSARYKTHDTLFRRKGRNCVCLSCIEINTENIQWNSQKS